MRNCNARGEEDKEEQIVEMSRAMDTKARGRADMVVLRKVEVGEEE